MQFIHGSNLAKQMEPEKRWHQWTGRSLKMPAFEQKAQAMEHVRQRQKFYSIETAVNNASWPAGFAPFPPLFDF
jgi:hypothetical protein